MIYPHCYSRRKSSPKTKFEKVFLWNSLVFMLEHGDKSSGDSKWDWKCDFSDCKWFDYISYTYYHSLGTKSQNLGRI